MKKFILPILTSVFIFSCADAEVVSGNYKGKYYGTDTTDAVCKISLLSDSYVSLEISSANLQNGYTEHARIEKNSDHSYNLLLPGNNSTLILSGYYYDGFIHINALSSGYIFQGKK